MNTLLKLVFALLVVSAFAKGKDNKATPEPPKAPAAPASDAAPSEAMTAVQNSLSSATAALSELDRKVASSMDVIKTCGKDASSASTGVADVQKQVQSLAQEVRELKTLTQNVLSNIGSSEQASLLERLSVAQEKILERMDGEQARVERISATQDKFLGRLDEQALAILDRLSAAQERILERLEKEQDNGLLKQLSAAQERILERLDGSVMDQFGNILNHLQAFTATYFQQVTVLGKSLLSHAKNLCGGCDWSVEKILSRAPSTLQSVSLGVFDGHKKIALIFRNQGLDSELSGYCAWALMSTISLIALFGVIKFLSFLICGVLCCRMCKKRAVTAKKPGKPNKKKPVNK